MNHGLPATSQSVPTSEIAELAIRFRRANGPVMKLVNLAGGAVENVLSKVPAHYHSRIEEVIAQALEASYGLAARSPELGERTSMAAVVASGAAGGAGGLATAIAELPVTVTIMLNAIRAEARVAGFDPDDEDVRAQCLLVFGSGSPLASDDGVNTAFLSARLSVSGQAVQSLISKIAPKLATALGPKIAAQAVPLLGAFSGAALNAAFLSYYREIASVRFALLKLSETHGTEPVLKAFAAAVEQPRITRA